MLMVIACSVIAVCGILAAMDLSTYKRYSFLPMRVRIGCALFDIIVIVLSIFSILKIQGII